MTAKLNILIFMVDQLTGTLFEDGPADWLHAPNLAKLADRSTRFANAYTASPLCAPGRASFMSGLLPSRSRVYDNAAEFSADIPTYAHHLRRAGYQTCLSGKMHFVGPDQLHGFEERLTTDIYPADFGWTPDYRKPGERIDWWYHNLGSVTGAGVAEISNQMEYDDEVAFHGAQKVYDLARGHDARPWCLTVSFTHTHDPYVARRKYWDLYEGCDHLLPEVPAMAYEDHDAHSKRIFDANDWRSFDITEADIRRSRRAYFANISYIDDKIGEVMTALEGTRQDRETIILFLADHGDMLGERGLWFKMSFFEGSSRVPLMISAPGMAPGLVTAPVSTIDVCPTLCDLAGADMSEVMPWVEGTIAGPAGGRAANPTRPWRWNTPPRPAMRRWFACATGAGNTPAARSTPEQLYDLDADPHELTNLADDAAHAETLARLQAVDRDPAGISTPSTRRSAKARRAARSSTRRCARAAITRGITSRCKRRRSDTCAITWISTWSRKTSVSREANDGFILPKILEIHRRP